jgi:hypothetical protein
MDWNLLGIIFFMYERMPTERELGRGDDEAITM